MKRLFQILFLFCLSLTSVAPAESQTNSYKEVKIFIDADMSFVANAGGTAEANTAIRELVAQVDAIYRSQLGLTVTLVGTHLWSTSDPFNHSSQSALLASFASYGEANYRSTYTYDVAHLLIGSGLGGEGGIAYQGTACGDLSTATQAYSLSQPDLTDVYQFNPHLFSHELGHTLNSDHDALPACAKETIMCEAQIGGDFSDASKATIASYVQARESSGCFPTVAKVDPASTVRLKLAYSGATVKYKILGGGSCTTLTLVTSPSVAGLEVLFGYLQIGKLTPSATVRASSKRVLGLRGAGKKAYVGVYCDGQLTSSIAKIKLSKIRANRYTYSAVQFLRSLQSRFRSS